ncbi:cytochrome P450 4V2 [Bicyclus anynana]|uniref:Cytochrome P450 4V2 n=1 Tax=Bicyclus anynana TaxID=110368 RepID=A0ABM3M143_BICAN|nr:cytochrome P450 4V2 [Bicyclus anynana]
MWIVILPLVALCCTAWWVITNKDVPPAYPGYLPLIGHAHLLIGDSINLWNLVKMISYKSLKAEGAVSLWIGPRRLYFVADPNDFLKVANTCFEKDEVYEYAKPWMGNGLVTSDALLWKAHRKMLNPAFNPAVLDGFMEMFNSQARRLVTSLEVEAGRGPFDHWAYSRRNALETICFGALGMDFRDKKELFGEYASATEELFNIFSKRFQTIWLHSDFMYNRSKLKKRQDELLPIVHNMSNGILKKKKADILNCDNVRGKEKGKETIFKPFLDLILELSKERGTFNDEEIREHIDNIIMAGYDASAIVVTYALVLVGSYPHIQEKVCEELHKVFGDEDRDVTKQDLSKLVYIDAVFKETMRFYPVVPVVARHLDKDIILRNCTLSKGKTCILSVYGVHRHPVWGLDAEEFKPERWLDPATLPDVPNAFAGFSMGRRNCIGQTYASMSIRIILSHIFRNYKVFGDHTKMVARFDVLLKPVSGYHVQIEKKNK